MVGTGTVAGQRYEGRFSIGGSPFPASVPLLLSYATSAVDDNATVIEAVLSASLLTGPTISCDLGISAVAGNAQGSTTARRSAPGLTFASSQLVRFEVRNTDAVNTLTSEMRSIQAEVRTWA
jgi:hypothetical protein